MSYHVSEEESDNEDLNKNKHQYYLMKRLLPITILAASTLVVLAGKPRVKKTTKKTVVTHQKKQTVAKRETVSIPHFRAIKQHFKLADI